MKWNSASPQKHGWTSYVMERLLFSERFLVRVFRLSVLAFMISGWGSLGSFVFEANRDINSFWIDFIRYALAPLAAAISAFMLGAHYIQDIYELPNYSASLRYLLASMFDGPPYFFISGKLLPVLNIKNGKADEANVDKNLLERIGGPGWVAVEAGNVVLMEYLNKPARVLGPGWHFVPRLQHVEEIFTLEDQRWEANPILATTKDGIEILVKDFQFGYRLATRHGNPRFKRTDSDPYPFSAKSVMNLAYHRSVRQDGNPMAWGNVLQFRLDGKITDFINKNPIDAIIAPVSGDPRKKILDDLSDPKLRDSIKDYLGTEITWRNIGQFEINDENIGRQIKDYRLRAWFAQWAGKAALIRAEGKAEQISQTEGGRIEKTTSMLRGILQALNEVNLEGDVDEHLWNIVLARTAQIIEAMTSMYGLELSDNAQAFTKGES
jgi:hypothetical protein